MKEISDELPGIGGEYLVFTLQGKFEIARYDAVKQSWCVCDEDNDPVFWMMLPDRPDRVGQ